MINTIIFDFGDIFVNLNKQETIDEFKKLGLDGPNADLVKLNTQFEKGHISENDFVNGFKKYIPKASDNEIRNAWNTVIGEFPLYRLEFLQMLVGKYKMFLLTNTDSIHIDYFEQKVGESFSRDFYQCFEKVYYSYEMGKRKPEIEIYTELLKNTIYLQEKPCLLMIKREY